MFQQFRSISAGALTWAYIEQRFALFEKWKSCTHRVHCPTQLSAMNMYKQTRVIVIAYLNIVGIFG